jgi:hypothetical protein
MARAWLHPSSDESSARVAVGRMARVTATSLGAL